MTPALRDALTIWNAANLHARRTYWHEQNNDAYCHRCRRFRPAFTRCDCARRNGG